MPRRKASPSRAANGRTVPAKMRKCSRKDGNDNIDVSAPLPPQPTVSLTRLVDFDDQSTPSTQAKSRTPAGSSGNRATPPNKSREIGNPLIKSPLDTHGYKVLRAVNGLTGLLVSTCTHSLDIEVEKGKKRTQKLANCAFDKVAEFNKTYADFDTRTSHDGEQTEKKNYTFSDASKTQKQQTRSKRLKAETTKRAPKVKCKHDYHEQNDEMQNFCDTKCVGVMYVKAGFFQDPPDVPGMAHFCEHCLYLGSKNFPEAEAFSKFVDPQGGMSNARTDQESTIYYFYIDYEQIDHTLDMFADMFANPIFKSSAIAKEIDNINSEFEIKRLLDDLRQFAILKSCTRKDHPVSAFGLGSKDSLSDKDIVDKLKGWIDKYYFAENMFFALQGPLALPELENLFTNFASKIPGRKKSSMISRPLKPLPGSTLLPFDMKKLNQIYYMGSAGSVSTLTITWPLDPKFGKNYATKPLNYYTHILTNKGHGSLDWYLKQRGWITSLMVNNNNPERMSYCTEYFTLVSISMELTDYGIQEGMDVLQTVFKYIEMLQSNLTRYQNVSKSIFTELQQLQADIFHYRSDLNLSDPTFGRKFEDWNVNETLWTLLHVLSKTQRPGEVLLSSFLMRKYDPQVLNEFISSMKPSNSMVIFASESFSQKAQKSSNEEKWYKTKYYTQKMPEEFITPALFKNLPGIPQFSIPKPNPFITVSLCCPNKESGKKIELRDDLLAYESEKGLVTYGNSKCKRGLLPSAQYLIDFKSPAIEDDTDLLNYPCLEIFALLYKHILDVELGLALSTLISYDIGFDAGRIHIALSGPSQKLPQLARTIFHTMENFHKHAQMYSKTIEDLKRSQIGYYKWLMNNSEECAKSLLDYVLSMRSHFLSDFVRTLEEAIEYEDFMSFVEDFQRSMYVEGDLYGCVSNSQATQVAQCIDELQMKPYQKKLEHEIIDRTIELPLGERCLLVSAKNVEDGNVIVLNYYQIKVMDPETYKILAAITDYLQNMAFEVLRTKQSLGYFTDVSIKRKNGIYGVTVLVNGAADKHTCGYINEKIDDFLVAAFRDCFATLAEFKEKIIPFWEEEHDKTKYNEAKKFYQKYLHPRGEQFSKLSIQIQGHKTAKSYPMVATEVADKIKKYSSNVKLFRCKGDGANCGISKYSNYLDLCLKNIKEENGYYITNVQQFKNDRGCLPNLEHKYIAEDDEYYS